MEDLEFVRLAIFLLDDQHGINAESWRVISVNLAAKGGDDVVSEVEASQGRIYLPEDAAQALRAKYQMGKTGAAS